MGSANMNHEDLNRPIVDEETLSQSGRDDICKIQRQRRVFVPHNTCNQRLSWLGRSPKRWCSESSCCALMTALGIGRLESIVGTTFRSCANKPAWEIWVLTFVIGRYSVVTLYPFQRVHSVRCLRNQLHWAMVIRYLIWFIWFDIWW